MNISGKRGKLCELSLISLESPHVYLSTTSQHIEYWPVNPKSFSFQIGLNFDISVHVTKDEKVKEAIDNTYYITLPGPGGVTLSLAGLFLAAATGTFIPNVAFMGWSLLVPAPPAPCLEGLAMAKVLRAGIIPGFTKLGLVVGCFLVTSAILMTYRTLILVDFATKSIRNILYLIWFNSKKRTNVRTLRLAGININFLGRWLNDFPPLLLYFLCVKSQNCHPKRANFPGRCVQDSTFFPHPTPIQYIDSPCAGLAFYHIWGSRIQGP